MGFLRKILRMPEAPVVVPGQPMTMFAAAQLIVAGAHDFAFQGPDAGLKQIVKSGEEIDGLAFKTRVELPVFYASAFLVRVYDRYGVSLGDKLSEMTADQLTSLFQTQLGSRGTSVNWPEVQAAVGRVLRDYASQGRSISAPEDLAKFGRQAAEAILGKSPSITTPAILVNHWIYVRDVATVMIQMNPIEVA
jgi:hypothetical protein